MSAVTILLLSQSHAKYDPDEYHENPFVTNVPHFDEEGYMCANATYTMYHYKRSGWVGGCCKVGWQDPIYYQQCANICYENTDEILQSGVVKKYETMNLNN
jgi:hypothetical protein